METVTPDVNNLSTEELRSFLGGEPVSPAPDQVDPTPELEPAGNPEPSSVAPPEEPEPEPEPEPAGDPNPEPLNKQRIRPRDALDQQVLDLYKSEGFSGTMEEAVATIYGTQHSNPPAAEPSGGESPTSDPDGSAVDKLRQEAAELEIQIDEAADDMDTREALRLQRELTRKEQAIAKAESEQAVLRQREEDAQVQQHRDRVYASWDAAVSATPELGDTSSDLRKQFDTFKKQKENDPDYAPVFASVRWPELLVRDFLVESQAAPAVKPTNPNPPAPTKRPSGATVLTRGSPPAAPTRRGASQQAILNNLDKVPTDKLRELLGAPT